jgi:hypothetical protein
MTNEAPARLVTGQRGGRYGEVLAVFVDGERFSAQVYGTQLLNDCPQELWEKLDAPSIAEELGAVMVKLNGPRYWMIDGLGSKGQPVEPVVRDFRGILMRRIAVVDLGTNPAPVPYTVRHVDRKAVFFFDAGSTVHELVDGDGLTYVMQAYCVGVDPALTEGSLAGLGDRLDLPEGWAFRTRTLDEELIVDTSETVATVLQDELENTYTLPG